LINRDISNGSRRANELLSILRIAFLYGCFKREDIEHILNVKRETLNRQYGLASQVTELIPAIPDKRIDGRLVKYEDISVLTDDLWKIHNLEQEDIPINDNRKVQYEYILKSLAREGKKTARQIVKYCQDCMDKTGYDVNAEDRVLDAARKELRSFGIIKMDELKEYVFPLKLNLEADEENCERFKDFISYAMHILVPAIEGHYLLGFMKDWTGDDSASRKSVFCFHGYQPQKILDEKNMVELQWYIRMKKAVQFSYIDNDMDRLGIREASENQKRNVMPYKILHEIRYGRSFLVGYCLDNKSMRGYRLDRISNIKKSEKMWQEGISIKEEYEKSFAGTWMGGRIIEPCPERKKVKLEIMNPALNEGRIRKMGITPQRHGRICREGKQCYYEITVPNARDLKPWIMSLRNKVRIASVTGEKSGREYTFEPGELGDDIVKTLKEMAKRYGAL